MLFQGFITKEWETCDFLHTEKLPQCIEQRQQQKKKPKKNNNKKKKNKIYSEIPQ